MNSNGDICPYCGDILPEDGSPCPSCRHLHQRGLPDGADLDRVEQERALLDNTDVLCQGHPIWPQEVATVSLNSSGPTMLCPTPDTIATEASRAEIGGGLPVGKGVPLAEHTQEAPRQKRRYVWRGPHKRNRKPKPKVPNPKEVNRNEPVSGCIMCGELYYNTIASSCARCGGMCVVRTLDEMDWMARLNPNLAYLPRL